jgi:hypothetical protein
MGKERFHMDRLDILWLNAPHLVKLYSLNPVRNVINIFCLTRLDWFTARVFKLKKKYNKKILFILRGLIVVRRQQLVFIA